MEGNDRTFKVNFSSEGVSRLREAIEEKLKEFMGDYTDDTLVVWNQRFCENIIAFSETDSYAKLIVYWDSGYESYSEGLLLW